MEIYRSTVLSCGAMAEDFLADNIVILFGKGAPEELMDVSYIHEHKQPPSARLAAGDIISIGGHGREVLGVGEAVDSNFRNLGHLVLKFIDNAAVEMVGDVNLRGPVPPGIPVGAGIVITRPDGSSSNGGGSPGGR